MTGLISVVLFGHPDRAIIDKLRLPSAPAIEADDFDATAYENDASLDRILVERRPHVIFTFGSGQFPKLLAAPLEVRRRWVHYDAPPPPDRLAATALDVFIDVATNKRFPDEPLVSVFTPTYRTGERVARPFASLLDQAYRNWEWVVYDDSPDDETFEHLRALARDEPRVRLFRGDGNWGNIGEVKRRLCGLARGDVLVELDHDDVLTPNCLADVVEAFNTFPDAGFAYSDCAEMFDDGEPAGYLEGYAFDYGSYRWEEYEGRQLLVTNYPSINAKTIRHIVGVPNHVRAWRRSTYHEVGGYASEVHVADDYELLVRTFLATRFVHIQRFGYVQYITRAGENTQRQRNKEIQRLVRLFAWRYEQQIHERLVQLGVDDFIWRDGTLDWSVPNPPDTPIANYVLR